MTWPVRLDDTLVDFGLDELRVFLHRGLQCFHDFLHGLMKLGLTGIFFFNFGNDFLND